MSKRIVVDLSDLYDFFAKATPVAGVPRVNLNFAERLRINPKYEIAFAYYNPVLGCYLAFPEHASVKDFDTWKGLLYSTRVRPFRPEKYRNRPIRRLYHRHRVRFLRTVERTAKQWTLRRNRVSRSSKFRFRHGDVLLVLGAGWLVPETVWHIERLVNKRKITPVLLVHDVIPLLGITERSGNDGGQFRCWLHDFSRVTKRFITYSENSKADLENFLSKNAIKDYWIETFPLPHEFVVSDLKTPSAAISPITEKNYVLSVGPPQPKNGIRLAHAWAKLAREIGPTNMPRLVFAGTGRRADLPADILDEIGDLIDFAFRPTDAELAYLYKHALFTVFPSLYEGWGLPIAESLWFGKFCVASNTSSMPEVGGRLCDYFDPYDVASMVDALRRPIVDPEYRKKKELSINGTTFISWSHSTQLLLESVDRIINQDHPNI